MKIKLKELKLKNFKGVKSQKIDFKGKDVTIIGENATGKTTIFDAFTWLLFGKDSSYKTQFGIKTVDTEGNEIHGLEHEVEALLQVGNSNLTLKRIYKENWVTKRGEAEKVLSGHTTDYFVNDVIVKKKQYDHKINELVNEDIFKLITNPIYFNTEVHWRDRRNILMDIIGDVDDIEIINSKDSLKKLKSLLGDKDIEDFKKTIAYKKKKLKKEKESIPYRIDEVFNSIIKIDLSEEKINAAIDSLYEQLKTIDKAIKDESQLFKKNNEINKEIYQLEKKLTDIENKSKEDHIKPIERLKKKSYEIKSDIRDLEFNIESKEKEIKVSKKEIEMLEKKAENLRNKWFEKDKETFNENETICRTCGQKLPFDEISTIKERFDENRLKSLNEITSEGKQVKRDKLNLIDHVNDLERKLEELKFELKERNNDYEANKKKIDEMAEYEFRPTSEYRKIEDQINELKSNLVDPDNSDVKKLELEKIEINKEVKSYEKQLNQLDENKKKKKRIDELKEKERILANDIAELEGTEFLTEEFIRTKINLVEERINSKFKTLEFRLFETQINGGLNETCITLIGGVPFDDANNAAKINAGIEIINILSDYYEVSAPIFVDNAEAVNKIDRSESQLIKLVVGYETDLTVKVA